MAILLLRTPGGRHLSYSDTNGRGNGYFSVRGCSGEVRSAQGYLILWHDEAGRPANALRDRIARARRFPRNLFELVDLPAVTQPGAVKIPSRRF